MADHEEGDEQEAEQLLLLAEHADVAEAIAAEVEHVAIDVPATHVNVVSVEEGEPIAVAVAPHALHDSTAIHVSVDAAGFGNGSNNHRDPNVSAYLLHSILEGNWPAVIERCKTHPEEIRYVDKRTRRTPLHEACGARPRSSIINRVPAEVIYAILDAAGSDARDLAARLDVNGNSPLQMACRDVKLWRMDPSSMLSGNETTAQSALRVAEGQTLEQWQGVIERLVNVCPEAAGWSNKNDLTPLMDACEHEFVPPEIIQLLLSVDEQVSYACDKSGKSALAKYGEASGKSLAVARLLLDECPESLLYQDSDGCTPLHRPSFELNVNLVETMLLRDESVASIADNKGLLPLHRACQRPRNAREDGSDLRLEVIRLLLDAYPEGCMATNDKGMAPIHVVSARYPNLDNIQSIYETQPDCLALQDNLGWTALHHVCHANCAEAVLYLLSMDASLAETKTRKDDTALHLLATGNCSASAAQKLVELYPDAVLARNDYGFTPLHVACREAGASADFIRILYDTDPNVLVMRTNAGELPIHLICQRSQVSPNVLRFCLENVPPDLDVALPRSGHNPLHEACLRRLPLELIEILSEQKPEWVTAKNSQGQTPLHLICKVSRGVTDISVIQTLVRFGGAQQINDGDDYSHTPFLSSLRQDASLELITFLLKACPEAINGVHSYFVGSQKYFGTALEIAVNRDVPSAVLRVVARAGDASVITSPNEDGIAPIQTIMHKCHDFRRNVDHAFDYGERLHRAFFLVAVALDRNVDAELWNDDGVSTSLSLLDILSFRRKFGSEFVVGEVIWFLMDMTLTSPLDPDGNTPLHIEAAVSQRPSRGEIKLRPFGVEARTKNHLCGVLTRLIEAFPTNIATSNNEGELPFDVMIKSDRGWESGIAILIERYPQALLAWLERQKSPELLLPPLLQKITRHCGLATALILLQHFPKFADYHK